jgi:hypothetical protein
MNESSNTIIHKSCTLIDTKKKGNTMNESERKELAICICKVIAKNIVYYYAAKELGLMVIPLILVIEFI